MKKTSFFVFGVVVALIVAFSVPGATSAQTYYGYNPNDKEATIAYLHSIINQLLAQLAARQQFGGGYQYDYDYNYDYGYQYQNPYYYQPYGQVLGASYSRGRYDVEVGTNFVRRDRDDIYLNGQVYLQGSPYAYVWFEYDEDDRGDLDERTSRKYVTGDSYFSAHLDEDDFNGRGWFSYRAVAESASGHRDYGAIRQFYISGTRGRDSRNDDDEPDVETLSARNIEDDRATLRGEVDMNDFRSGLVFFVYGEDEDQVEDIEDDYDEFADIDEDGDDLQKVRVDSDLDGRDDYSKTVTGLDGNTDYFFQICVEYEDEDDDEVIKCGGVEEFETD